MLQQRGYVSILDDDDGDSGYVRYEEPDDNYLAWLAEQQLAKQDEGELAERSRKVERVRLDFRGLAPRGQSESERGEQSETRKVEKVRKSKHKPVDTTKAIDAADLLLLNLPPLKWVVPDLIPEGTLLLAASPKIGKSSLVYQACVECALGGTLLGRQVAQGDVLYAALEDGPRRGQMKVRTALQGRKMPHGALTVWWNAPSIGNGLEEALAEWLASVDNPVLVAIDTLERIRPDSDSRKESAYRTDVRHLTQLQDAFKDRDVALVIVHHARKEKGDDFVQAVSGTYGLTGSVDTILSIERRRNDQYAVIRVTGREVGEIELPVRMDDVGLWSWAPEAAAAVSSERMEVFQIIQRRGPIWPQQVARIMGSEGESGRVSVQQMMSKLVTEGVISKGRGGYSVVPDATAYSDYSEGQKH